MQTLLGVKLFPVEDLFKFPKFYQYLSEKDFPNVKFSLKEQKVLISVKGYKMERALLKEELEKAGIECSLGRTRRTLLADSKSVLNLLADYFGKAPVLETFSLAEENLPADVPRKQKEL